MSCTGRSAYSSEREHRFDRPWPVGARRRKRFRDLSTAVPPSSAFLSCRPGLRGSAQATPPGQDPSVAATPRPAVPHTTATGRPYPPTTPVRRRPPVASVRNRAASAAPLQSRPGQSFSSASGTPSRVGPVPWVRCRRAPDATHQGTAGVHNRSEHVPRGRANPLPFGTGQLGLRSYRRARAQPAQWLCRKHKAKSGNYWRFPDVTLRADCALAPQGVRMSSFARAQP